MEGIEDLVSTELGTLVVNVIACKQLLKLSCQIEWLLKSRLKNKKFKNLVAIDTE